MMMVKRRGFSDVDCESQHKTKTCRYLPFASRRCVALACCPDAIDASVTLQLPLRLECVDTPLGDCRREGETFEPP